MESPWQSKPLFFPLQGGSFRLEQLVIIPASHTSTWQGRQGRFAFAGFSSLSFTLPPQSCHCGALQEGRVWWKHHGGERFSPLSTSSSQMTYSQPSSQKPLLNPSEKDLSLTARRQRKIIHTKNKLCHESFDFAFPWTHSLCLRGVKAKGTSEMF